MWSNSVNALLKTLYLLTLSSSQTSFKAYHTDLYATQSLFSDSHNSKNPHLSRVYWQPLHFSCLFPGWRSIEPLTLLEFSPNLSKSQVFCGWRISIGCFEMSATLKFSCMSLVIYLFLYFLSWIMQTFFTTNLTPMLLYWILEHHIYIVELCRF